MTTSKVLPPPTVNTRLPFVTIVATTMALLLPLAAVGLMYWQTRSPSSPGKLSAGQKLRELQAEEEWQLTTYDWIERPTGDKPGVIRIPINRARELVLKETTSGQ